jgi:hypothetical protein
LLKNAYLCYFYVVFSVINSKSRDYLCFIISIVFLKFPNFLFYN